MVLPVPGKSTVASTISDVLRNADIAHIVIDIDELARIYPETHPTLKWDNLAGIWPNLTDLAGLKVILPVLLDTEADLRRLQAATPSDSFSVCQLNASPGVLKERVTRREPTEFWQSKLRGLVDSYEQRGDHDALADFAVSTENRSPADVADDVIRHLGWIE